MDVDTGESLFVPIKVVLADRTDNGKDSEEERVTAAAAAAAADDGDGDGDDDGRTNAGGTAIMGDSRHAEDVSGGGDDDGSGNGCSRGGQAAAAAAAAGGRGGAGGTLSLVTPCVLPDLKDVSRLAVCSPRYFPVELDIAGNPAVASALQRRCRIYVKRRVGHLSFKNVSV